MAARGGFFRRGIACLVADEGRAVIRAEAHAPNLFAILQRKATKLTAAGLQIGAIAIDERCTTQATAVGGREFHRRADECLPTGLCRWPRGQQCAISWSFCASRRTTLPPAMTGEDCPGPAAICHSTFGSVGSLSSGWAGSLTMASRFGPRHCGQSAAWAAATTKKEAQMTRREVFMTGVFYY